MENDNLDQLWSKQGQSTIHLSAKDIVSTAKKQRRGQYFSIIVMGITLIILMAYTFYFAVNYWNDFTLGLVLMMSSLSFRIILEFITIYKKQSRLIILNPKAYTAYLKRHYRNRLGVNYVVTPLCFLLYGFGFYLLLPFFKLEFSSGFYNYILISGMLSVFILVLIVGKSVIKEHKFLSSLKHE